MKTTTDLYLVRCITNLHAGAGTSNYGIVDNEVQRDPIDESPIVHTSSLKGAFRELFEYYSVPGIETIFGFDSKADESKKEGEENKGGAQRGEGEKGKEQNDSSAAQYFFYPAQLLFYPVRSSVRPFFYATSNALIEKYIAAQVDVGTSERAALEKDFRPLLDLNPARERPVVFTNEGQQVFVDEYEADNRKDRPGIPAGVLPQNITLDRLALFHDDGMKEIYRRLPVIARNVLDNGISKNLWYEEVVPRESWFYFFVSRPDSKNLFKEGLDLPQIKRKVQIGGNASVGYGLCMLEPIDGKGNEK